MARGEIEDAAGAGRSRSVRAHPPLPNFFFFFSSLSRSPLPPPFFSPAASLPPQSILVNASRNLGALGGFIFRQFSRAGWLLDYAWFFGSTALLLTLPVLVEIQRETTVLVMQRQKEQEMLQMQEQAKAANAGVIDQLKGFGSLVLPSALGGSAPPPQ